jgi:peroxiredoxin Q/BCP
MAFPEVGAIAPEFEVQTDDGSEVKLSDYRGQKVVLYFYPKADTPGCTVQACTIRDNYGKFQEKGVVVLGASPDTVADQAAFKQKYSLPFILLADADHSLSELYGVWEGRGTRRSTLIIDPDGKVSYAQYGVDPTNNTAELLEILS